MRARRIISAAAVAAVCLVFASQSARAQHPGTVLVYPYYPTYAVDQLPYFSQSPPVYYSEIMPRSYGMSPYPYPGSCMCSHAPHEAVAKPAVLRPMKRAMEPKASEMLQVDTGRVRATIHLADFGHRRVKTIHFNR